CAGLARQVRPGDVDAAHRNSIIATGSTTSFFKSEIMARLRFLHRRGDHVQPMIKQGLPDGAGVVPAVDLFPIMKADRIPRPKTHYAARAEYVRWGGALASSPVNQRHGPEHSMRRRTVCACYGHPACGPNSAPPAPLGPFCLGPRRICLENRNESGRATITGRRFKVRDQR